MSFAGLTAFNLLAFNLLIMMSSGISSFQDMKRSLKKIGNVLRMEEKPDTYVRLDPVDGKLEHVPETCEDKTAVVAF